MGRIPRVGHGGHLGRGSGGSDRFDIGNHITGPDQLHNGSNTNLILLNEVGIESGGFADGHSTHGDGFHVHGGFQISVFGSHPFHVHHMRLGDLIR